MPDKKDKELSEKDLKKATGGAVDPRLTFKTGHVRPGSGPTASPVDPEPTDPTKKLKKPGQINPM
jgi:hypothetical protein